MTTTLKLAHIREQGQDMIIIPVNASRMIQMPDDERERLRNLYQLGADEAGLSGVVCLSWEVNHRLHSVAPPPWRPFFESIDMDYIQVRLNRTLTISFSD